MLKKETTTIGGCEYVANQLPAPKGMVTLEWLLKKLGPGIEVMFDGGSEIEIEGQATQTGVFKGIGAIFSQLSGNDLEYLYNQFAEHCTVNGTGMDKPDVKNFHFSGKYGEYLQWIIWMLQINYQSFFVGLGTLKNVASAQGFPIASKSTSPTE